MFLLRVIFYLLYREYVMVLLRIILYLLQDGCRVLVPRGLRASESSLKSFGIASELSGSSG